MTHFGFPVRSCKIAIYTDLHNHITNNLQKKPKLKIAVESAALAADVPVTILWIRSEYLEE